MSGEEQTIDAIRKNNVYLVLLASDAGKNTTKSLIDKSTYYNVKLIDEYSTLEISNTIGKQNRVVVGITDKGIASAILKRRGE